MASITFVGELVPEESARPPVDGAVPESLVGTLPRARGLPPGLGIPKDARGAQAEMAAVGGGTHVHFDYVDQRGNICTWRSDMLRGVMQSGGGGGCAEPRELAREIARSPAFYHGTAEYGRFGFLTGHGRSDLTKVDSQVPGVRVDSVVTGEWAPGGNAPEGFTLKGFLVRVWYGPGVRVGSVIDGAVLSRNLDLVGIFADGEIAPLESSSEARGKPVPPTRLVDPIQERKRSHCDVFGMEKRRLVGLPPCERAERG